MGGKNVWLPRKEVRGSTTTQDRDKSTHFEK